MAKVIIKRENLIAGCAVKHDVYLSNKFLGTLKNGGVLNFNVSVGSYTLYFISRYKFNKENINTKFYFVVNDEQEVVEILTKFNLSGKYVAEYADNLPHVVDNKGFHCPACGSSDLTTISETYTTGEDFNSLDACCGYLLCGPIGLLCGVDGKGKQQRTENYWVCKNCGNKFKM